MKMKTGVEQSAYSIFILSLLPEAAVLPGEAISHLLGVSPTYLQKLLRKLVHSELIVSVPGVKGGFRLEKSIADIQIYDLYLAVEGQQSLYSSQGLLNEMLALDEKAPACPLVDLMSRAEASWQSVLKSETIASLYAEMEKEFQPKVQALQKAVGEKMVLS